MHFAIKQFQDVPARFGAPMGRRYNVPPEGTQGRLFAVTMVDGDYDDGGAYWGGNPSHTLYCFRWLDGEIFNRCSTTEGATLWVEQTLKCKVSPERDFPGFFAAYLEAVRFTDCGPDDEYTEEDEFTDEFLAQALQDCKGFFAAYWHLLPVGTEHQAGHDLWFTRNGHGVGFSDRDCYGSDDLVDQMEAAAAALGSCDAEFKTCDGIDERQSVLVPAVWVHKAAKALGEAGDSNLASHLNLCLDKIDLKITEYGARKLRGMGGFAGSLYESWTYADSHNRKRLEDAFSDLFRRAQEAFDAQPEL